VATTAIRAFLFLPLVQAHPYPPLGTPPRPNSYGQLARTRFLVTALQSDATQRNTQHATKHMENAEFSDIVGIREAADILGVSASTISRQVKAGIIPNRGADGAPKVSVREAREARAKNTDPAQRRAGHLRQTDTADGSYHSQRAERERVGTELKRLELAERLDAVVPKASAESALFSFGRRLRDEMTNRWPTLAQDLQNLDAAEIARIGVERDERLLQRIIEEIEKDHDLLARPS
jgi:hypothetical protein